MVNRGEVTIVIPMAGRGSRFAEAGYEEPKPLISINDIPMIQLVINSLRTTLPHRFVFICLQEHLDKGLREVLEPIGTIHVLDKITEGSACTILEAAHLIYQETPLVIANCDQYVRWNFTHFLNYSSQFDGCILTFESTNPACSFAEVSGDRVVRVAEKVVISNHATVGIYYFDKGKYYINAAERMIAKDIRTNNEFYNCPVYNEMIEDGKYISTYHIDLSNLHMLGYPEELETFKKKVEEGIVTI